MKGHAAAATAAVAIVATTLMAACGPSSDEESATNQPATEEVTPQPAPAPSTAQPSDAVAMLTVNAGDEYGAHLTDINGSALYIFTADQQGQSSCDQECAQVWKPLTVGQAAEAPQPATGTPGATTPEATAPATPAPSGESSATAAEPNAAASSTVAGQIQSDLVGTIQRADGTTQVTYAGHPLYLYSDDHAPGDVKGQDLTQFGGEWYLVSPAGDKIEAKADQGSS